MLNPAEIVHGPMLIGLGFNILLLGVSTTQTYLYYTHYKRDNFWLKTFVALLLVGNFLNTVFDFVYVYRAIIVHFGNVPNLFVTNWLVSAEPTMTVLISSAVQGFFAWRTYALTKHWLYPVLIVSTSVASTVGGIWTTVNFVHDPTFSDIYISKLFLRKRKHKTGFDRSDLLVDRVIRIAVQTGLLTVTVALADLIVYLLNRTSSTHLIFNLPLCKVFVVSLLSNLNSRQGWAYSDTEGSQSIPGNNAPKNSRKQPAIWSPAEMLDFAPERTEVFIHVESHALGDLERSGVPRAHSIPDESDSEDHKASQRGWEDHL